MVDDIEHGNENGVTFSAKRTEGHCLKKPIVYTI